MTHNWNKRELFKKNTFDIYVSICLDHISKGYEITNKDFPHPECFICDKKMKSKLVRVKVIKELLSELPTGMQL